VEELVAHLFAEHNLPFAIALFLFGLIGVLQVASFLVGSTLFAFLDDWFPSLDIDADASADASADVDAAAAPGFVASVFSMLRFGRVPFVISLLLWLLVFAFIGYNAQLISVVVREGRPIGVGWAALLSFVLSLPLVRAGNQALARLLPRDETRAVSEEDLVGSTGRITVGTVTHTQSSEACVLDGYENSQYIQVVSEDEGETFVSGAPVLVVRRAGHLYTVVADPTAAPPKLLESKEGTSHANR
jgi:hypothetical protein